MTHSQKHNVYIFVPAAGKGGVTTRSAKWAKQLVKNGHRVTVVFWEDSSSPYSVNLERRQFDTVSQLCIKFDSLDKTDRTARSLLEQIPFEKQSVMISGAWRNASVLANEARKQGIDLTYLETLVGDDETNYQTAICSSPIFNGVITIGKRIKKNVSAKLPIVYRSKPICAVAPGAPVSNEQPVRQRSATLQICYVGRLDPIQKRVYDLVEIATGLAQKNIDFHLSVIGGGNDFDDLKNLCHKRAIASQVTFLGKLPFEKVQEKLLKNDLFLLPSAFEGFSGALCEAMAVGLIPVATRISGTEDVVQNSQNGYLLEVGDITGFVETIASLAGKKAELERLSHAAWETARNELSLESIVLKIETLITEAMTPPIEYQSNYHSSSGLLNANWMPNFITRFIRKIWRAYKGKPADVGAKK